MPYYLVQDFLIYNQNYLWFPVEKFDLKETRQRLLILMLLMFYRPQMANKPEILDQEMNFVFIMLLVSRCHLE